MNAVVWRVVAAATAIAGTTAAYAACFVLDVRQPHALAAANAVASFVAAWMSVAVQARLPSNRANAAAVAVPAGRYRVLATSAWLGMRVALRLAVLAPVCVLVAYQFALPFAGGGDGARLEAQLFAALDLLALHSRWAALLAAAFVACVVAFATRTYAVADADARLASLTAALDGAGASALGIAALAAFAHAAHPKEEIVASP